MFVWVMSIFFCFDSQFKLHYIIYLQDKEVIQKRNKRKTKDKTEEPTTSLLDQLRKQYPEENDKPVYDKTHSIIGSFSGSQDGLDALSEILEAENQSENTIFGDTNDENLVGSQSQEATRPSSYVSSHVPYYTATRIDNNSPRISQSEQDKTAEIFANYLSSMDHQSRVSGTTIGEAPHAIPGITNKMYKLLNDETEHEQLSPRKILHAKRKDKTKISDDIQSIVCDDNICSSDKIINTTSKAEKTSKSKHKESKNVKVSDWLAQGARSQRPVKSGRQTEKETQATSLLLLSSCDKGKQSTSKTVLDIKTVISTYRDMIGKTGVTCDRRGGLDDMKDDLDDSDVEFNPDNTLVSDDSASLFSSSSRKSRKKKKNKNDKSMGQISRNILTDTSKHKSGSLVSVDEGKAELTQRLVPSGSGENDRGTYNGISGSRSGENKTKPSKTPPKQSSPPKHSKQISPQFSPAEDGANLNTEEGFFSQLSFLSMPLSLSQPRVSYQHKQKTSLSQDAAKTQSPKKALKKRTPNMFS